MNAFLAAVHEGDFEALVAVLDPEVVLRSDRGPGAFRLIQGAREVARQAIMFSRLAQSVQPVLVNGVAGIVSWHPNGQVFSVMSFTIKAGKVVDIDVLGDPARLRQTDLTFLK